jgi:hypothetical protein
MTDAPAPGTRSRGARLARTFERVNLALVGLALVVTHLLAGFGPFLTGVLVGGVLGALNLRGMVWLTARLLAAAAGSRGQYAALFAVKLALLGSLVWLALSRLPADSVGFLIGFSTILPAALWLAFLRALEPAERDVAPGAPRPTTSTPHAGRSVSRYATSQEQRS